ALAGSDGDDPDGAVDFRNLVVGPTVRGRLRRLRGLPLARQRLGLQAHVVDLDLVQVPQPQRVLQDFARVLGVDVDLDDGVIADRDDGLSQDRKSTRLNSSHVKMSYAVFCLKDNNNGRATVS